jgi:hypothetical protein
MQYTELESQAKRVFLRGRSLAAAVLIWSGCVAWNGAAPDGDKPARTDSPDPAAQPDSRPESSPESSIVLAELRPVYDGRFATSLECATCHSNSASAQAMRDQAGNEIAPFDLWQSTMMANSARDPLWRAVVSAEVAALPSRKAEIEAKCMRCHAPMATRQAELDDQPPLALSLLYQDTSRSQIGLDGVSCTLCHQITSTGLGSDQSFNAGFDIGANALIYGPHANPFAMPMFRHTGYTPTESAHVTRSALCATCHTLFTEAYDAQGNRTGMILPEQTPYIEWRNSAYSTETQTPGALAADCQDCHMPTRSAAGVNIFTAIARNPGGFDFPRVGPRQPYGPHIFVGGNTLVPAILRDHAGELNPVASAQAFDATIAAARTQLEQHSARIDIAGATASSRQLTFAVQVRNITGHKLPTAHPSRRAWLRVVVRDGQGAIAFSSGAVDSAGVLLGADGAPLASELAGGPVQPHHDVIDDPAKVAVFESVMADSQGAPTYSLMRGARYAKDNRVLPQGWRSGTSDDALVGAVGIGNDPDFVAGSDRVHYQIDTAGHPGPYTIEATLLYQTASTRYLSELFVWDTAEVRAFRRYYEQADRTPVAMAVASAIVAAP